jgi:hypothetical protein
MSKFDFIAELMDQATLENSEKPASNSAPEVATKGPPIIIYDDYTNIIDDESITAFESFKLFKENELFSEAINTTNTLEGNITNVKFHEEELIGHVILSDRVVFCTCNYGTVASRDYKEIPKGKASIRGRKRKEKKKITRKIQGNGTCFNSQITLYVTRDPPHIFPFKFKVFRNGKIQLPGATQRSIREVVKCISFVVKFLNVNVSGKSHVLADLRPVMINYKFAIKLQPEQLIDLNAFRQIVERDMVIMESDEPIQVISLIDGSRVVVPAIESIKYTRQNVKLSVRFKTPMPQKPKKCIRLNVFKSGKLNLLGSRSLVATQIICDYIYFVFSQNMQQLVVKECI